MKYLLSLLCSLSLCAAAQENFWPDSGFEATGVPGGRTGKAIRLTSNTHTHWKSAGLRNIKVKSFATYELSAHVKGKAAAGSALVLYTYNYNCFGWFSAGEPHPTVNNATDWTKFTRRIISISDNIDIAPITFLEGGPGDFFLDDMSIVEILSPEETIKGLVAKTNKTTQDRQVLMRWYLIHDDEAAAKAAINFNATRERAEYHCLMAQRAKTEDGKLAHVKEMLAAGCYDFPDAAKRMAELLKGISTEKRLATCLAGLKAYPGENPKQLNCLYETVGSHMPQSLRDAQDQIAQLENARTSIQDFIASQKTLQGKEWFKVGLDRIDETIAKLKKWMSDFGYCKISLSRRPLTDCVIVLPAEPTPSESKAASELKLYLERQTSQELAIVPETATQGRFPIYIGRLPASLKNVTPVDYDHLRFDGIHIELTKDCLCLCGAQRGVLYAVYTFLEEQLGWRWFTDDCIVSPKDGTFDIKPFKNIYVPPFEYRRTSYIQYNKPELVVPLKLSAMDMDYPEWGGNYIYRGWVHTFQSLVPASLYAQSHPEYFSLINGKRVTERTQLCLTNPAVKQIAINTIRTWLKNSQKLPFAVSVSQNDWRNYCQCEKCTALAEKEGSQSGPLLHFVNGIAEEIGKEYPDVWIDTLAYQYTRKAPKYVKPAKNVIIRLCSIECCFVHGLDECERNKSFVKDIEDWSKISPFLSVWDYTINFANSTQPFPNLRVLQKNARFYRKWGVKGLFEQGNRFTKGGEFQDLRAYLIAKLLWNPDYNIPKAIREFTDAYYGAAAPYIRTYIEFMHDWICGTEDAPTDKHVWIYAPPQFYLNDPIKLAYADKLLEQAEAAVKNQPVFAQRAAVAHMPLWYTKLQLSTDIFTLDAQKHALVKTSQDLIQIADRFGTAADTVKLTAIREGGNHDQYLAWLNQKRGSAQASYQLETLKNQHGTVTVIPSLGGRVWSCRAADGREMMKIFGDAKKGYQPRTGGYEEFSTGDYQSPGWQEPYQIVEKDDSHIVLKLVLPDKRTLTRRIELLPDRAGFKVSTELVGGGKQQLRPHPAFAAQSLKDTSLWIRQGNAWHETMLSPTENSNIYFRGVDCPQGAWGFVNRKTGEGILNVFEAQQVDYCYLNASHNDQRLNLEQWGKLTEGKAVMVNTYEFWTKR